MGSMLFDFNPGKDRCVILEPNISDYPSLSNIMFHTWNSKEKKYTEPMHANIHFISMLQIAEAILIECSIKQDRL